MNLDKINRMLKAALGIFWATVLLSTFFTMTFGPADVRNQITGNSVVTGYVAVTILPHAINASNYKNRVFYEDGALINITVVSPAKLSGLQADFSCLDSNFTLGDETVSLIASSNFGDNYSITHRISQSNTVTNWNSTIDSSCPGGEECHRVCNVTVFTPYGVNETIELAFYEGDPDSSDAWYTGYVTRASNCAAGVASSNYFLEGGNCTSVYYNVGDSTYYSGAKDVDFSIKKKNTPDAVETGCNDGIDNDGDTAIDCDDSDCASIVYGEYFMTVGSNANKGYTPNWVCNRTQAGWRDDPPYDPGDLSEFDCVGTGGVCDATCASNLCNGTVANTNVTFPYAIAPDANFSVRLEQDNTINTYSVYFKLWQFNASLWQNGADDFNILNESASTGLNQEGKGTTSTSLIVQSGPFGSDPISFTGTKMDIVMKGFMNVTNNYRGLFGLVVNRIFNGSSEDFTINFNISEQGITSENNISCSDGFDNDLDYTVDCSDTDCDNVTGSTTQNDDGSYPICSYLNESVYALFNNTCSDEFDNDNDGTTDCHYSSGTWDLDCNNTYIVNASWVANHFGGVNGTCQLGTELHCNDSFDNDRDRAFDCNTSAFFTGGSILYDLTPDNPTTTYSGGASFPHGEYDCFNQSNCPSTEGATTCLDGIDNDLDFFQGAGDGTDEFGADCRMIEYDADCNGTAITGGTCQIHFELTCGDGFDNDQDGEYDCVAATTSSNLTNPEYQYSNTGSNTAHGEYDCQSTCNVSTNWENTSARCSDLIDNDLDYWTITGFDSNQYTATNNQYFGGMDCRFNQNHHDGGTQYYPDADCNATDMTGFGQVCQLGMESNCTDNYDNDQDGIYNPGGNRTNTSGGFDCDDYDCAGHSSCNQTEVGLSCWDGIDNDLDRYIFNVTSYLLDSDRVENTTGGVDCIYYNGSLTPDQYWPFPIAYDNYRFDSDCNNTIINSTHFCELIDERTCNDQFDNDKDYYISEIVSPGWNTTNYEYHFGPNTYIEDGDCNDYSCSGNSNCPSVENYTCSHDSCNSSQNWCLDGIDNDLDNYTFTGHITNSSTDAGIDCAWNDYDVNCNNTYINDSGFVGLCTLKIEYNCSDGVDNDQDLGTYVDGAAGAATAGNSTGVDCDDYNCYAVQENGNYLCTDDESGASIIEQVCNDTFDNDLDAFTWNGTAFNADTSTGVDCADPDCNGRAGPGGLLCALSEEMEFDPFDDRFCADYNSSGSTAYAQDNDNDNYANCFDSGCNGKGLCRACPGAENVTIDACADNLNNELEFQNTEIDKLNYISSMINVSMNDSAWDCLDSDCNGYIGLYNGVRGVCNSTAAGYLVLESDCTDGLDYDQDGLVDCEDPDCSSNINCIALYANSVSACTLKCADATQISYLGSEPPQYSTNTNWGSGTVDLTYTQYNYRGQNLTFNFTDTAANVNGNTVQLYLGSASETFIPTNFELNSSNSGIYGFDAANFNVQYSSQEGQYYQAVLIEYIGAYPNQVLNIGFYITVPNNDGIVTNSSYTYYVSAAIGGTERSSDVTQYVLETEAPQQPIFISTDITDDDNTDQRLGKVKADNSTTRASAEDPIDIQVNASDVGTWNSGIELCQFNNGSGWFNESAPYDCRENVSVQDGQQLVWARAVDGVGNEGPNATLNLSVTTLPQQVGMFWCGVGNCSDTYPVKNYYDSSEQFNISVNFSSVNGYTVNATGCLVYAEREVAGTRTNLGNISLTASGYCNGSVNLTSLTSDFYTIEVELTDDAGLKATSGEKPWSNGTKEFFWYCNYIRTPSGFTCKDACELDAADEPTAPILISPDGINTTATTQTFYWHNSSYNATSAPSYQIQIDDSPTFTSVNYDASGIAEGDNGTNHTSTVDLQIDKVYYWRVRAYYSLITGDWSETYNFTLNSEIGINLSRATVDFGSLTPDVSNDTSDNEPTPLLVENTGNIKVNITINATDLWETAANPTGNFTYKVDVNESNSFNTSASVLNYTDVPIAAAQSINDLNYSNSSDTAEIDFNITVPTLEPGGDKSATIRVGTI